MLRLRAGNYRSVAVALKTFKVQILGDGNPLRLKAVMSA